MWSYRCASGSCGSACKGIGRPVSLHPRSERREITHALLAVGEAYAGVMGAEQHRGAHRIHGYLRLQAHYQQRLLRAPRQRVHGAVALHHLLCSAACALVIPAVQGRWCCLLRSFDAS